DGTIRVVAGRFDDSQGPAETFTPVNIFDVHIKGGHKMPFSVAQGFTTAIFVVEGTVTVNDAHTAVETNLVRLDRSGSEFTVSA
ncbi:pirin-like C-terminal cupin domain-containing protein, partial [Vibrio parahaemolyticus]